MKRQVLVLIVLICSVFVDVNAESFFSHKYEGWHWYEAKKRELQEKANEVSNVKSSSSPTEQIKEIREMQEKLLHKALVDPSEANIVEYLRIQKLILDSSYRFTQGYRRVMQTHPELNETTKYPITQIGSQIYQKQKKEKHKRILQQASKTHGLFYFYKTSCPHCEQFIPVIKMFAEKYRFEIIPVSIDGKKHELLPKTQNNQVLAAKLNVAAVPAVYLVEPKTNSIIPASFGYTALDGLEEKVSFIYQEMTRGRNAEE